MFKIQWDKETGGVLLGSLVTKDTVNIPPRPVFFEELDLLGLKELGWEYPKSKEPLLWACNKEYYYRGKKVFEAKGANIYDKARIEFVTGKEKLRLVPVDISAMLERTKEQMFLCESEAIEFIRDTYDTYTRVNKLTEKHTANQLDFDALVAHQEKKTKQKMAIIKEDCDSFDIMPESQAEKQGKKVLQTTKVDYFIASFSGGKDSQVILDLCTRALPPDAFQVIYSDTGYELPSSLQFYEDVQKYYHMKYPSLLFRTAKNHESVLNYWDKIGTPSDKHRWCCAVMKTGPLYRMLKIPGTNKQAKVLSFEGVRAEESTRRSGYERIGRGVKHSTTINARPILRWSLVEIFLYIWKHKLHINSSYRDGMTRVGCLICPFASEWNEMMVKEKYPNNLKPFEERLVSFAKAAGVKDVDNYITQGGWKRRAGGNFVKKESFIDFNSITPHLVATIKNPKYPIDTFLATIGDYQLGDEKDGIRYGEIKIGKLIYKFTITKRPTHEIFRIENLSDAVQIGAIKRTLYKSTFCIQCETCEVECPTGALSIYPKVYIDKEKCTHCHKCLDFHEKGCIVANSLSITNNMTTNGKTVNIDRYKNFGLKQEWLDTYLIDQDNFWTSDHGLNENYQIPSLKCWLKDAGIIDDKSKITELGIYLAKIREDMPELIWSVVWTNLTYESFIVRWFANNVRPNSKYSQKLLEEMIRSQFGEYKEKTIHNAVYQLMRTLKESPVGCDFNQLNSISKEDLIRGEYTDISEIAVAYSVYKFGEALGVTKLRISDFYDEDSKNGPFKEFGIDKKTFEKALRSLNSSTNRVLIAELNMGLQHIILREDLNSLSVLKALY